MSVIYHLARHHEWQAAGDSGVYRGSREDRSDGFLHFSTAAQIATSAAKHRRGETDLTLLAVDSDALGDALRWEPARGGDLFPHLHGDLPLSAVLWSAPLPLGDDGLHQFPALE